MVFLESASFADQFYTMGSHQMLIVLLVIIVANYIFSQLLDWLNFKHSKEELPPEAEGIFDEVQYNKSQRYHKDVARFSFLTSAFSFVVVLAGLMNSLHLM